MSGLVSIITPSYNTSKYIGKTIESVLKQTYENWEMIIVDDCSTDDTDEVVKPYLSDKRIKYIKINRHLPYLSITLHKCYPYYLFGISTFPSSAYHSIALRKFSITIV